jgi:hypothetical protein
VGAEPLHSSDVPAPSAALEAGSRLVGFGVGFGEGLRSLKPQQYELASVLDAMHGESGVLMPRRSSKSLTILMWLLGLCELEEGVQLAYTSATTGKAARDRYVKELLPYLMRMQTAGYPLTARRASGQERVEFRNGSLLQILAPLGDEFRSQAFDVVVIDEAGEAEPEKSDDLLGAALPTLDTSDRGQWIVAGTAGDYREGNLLWDQLERGRAGAGGILEYAVPQDIDVDTLSDWKVVEELLHSMHPGVGTLTTMDAMRRSFGLMKPLQFAREYLGVWGHMGGAGGIFDATEWGALGTRVASLPAPPERFSLAVSASDSAASIVAAWRVQGIAHLLLIDHREGRGWVPQRARELAKKYRVPVVLDPQESTVMRDVKQSLEQLRTRVEVQTYEDVAAAHERIVLEYKHGRLTHYQQQPLTDAFLGVRRVQMGARWKFGAIAEADVTAARAATLAVRFFDSTPRAIRASVQEV